MTRDIERAEKKIVKNIKKTCCPVLVLLTLVCIRRYKRQTALGGQFICPFWETSEHIPKTVLGPYLAAGVSSLSVYN